MVARISAVLMGAILARTAGKIKTALSDVTMLAATRSPEVACLPKELVYQREQLSARLVED